MKGRGEGHTHKKGVEMGGYEAKLKICIRRFCSKTGRFVSATLARMLRLLVAMETSSYVPDLYLRNRSSAPHPDV